MFMYVFMYVCGDQHEMEKGIAALHEPAPRVCVCARARRAECVCACFCKLSLTTLKYRAGRPEHPPASTFLKEKMATMNCSEEATIKAVQEEINACPRGFT